MAAKRLGKDGEDFEDFTYMFAQVILVIEFEYVDDHRSGKIIVELNGRLNKCGVISPRFNVGVTEIVVELNGRLNK
ncbi:40S ribosomal protein S15a-1 [Canna indica]|uniref:Small ribosomal subunit protein uS8c n=1 Tax=Canna indica TaxID=4628 RepID=A0AAQ3QG28_9LILI|nr:40S ribosomal protein S15a-1 [Canna indica]